MTSKEDWDAFRASSLGCSKPKHRIRKQLASYDDIWLRDTAPIFRRDGSAVSGRFNGWAHKAPFRHDTKLAEHLALQMDAPFAELPIVLEGGALEFDGAGRVMTTESCLLHADRNPDGKDYVEHCLKSFFGVTEVIWLEGYADEGDITDGHVDGYARFAPGGKVVVERPPKNASKRYRETWLRDIARLRRRFGPSSIVELDPPVWNDEWPDQFCATYLNYYVVTGAVIVPSFAPLADRPARKSMFALFPDRDIALIELPTLLSGGGSIHCATREAPLRGLEQLVAAQ